MLVRYCTHVISSVYVLSFLLSVIFLLLTNQKSFILICRYKDFIHILEGELKSKHICSAHNAFSLIFATLLVSPNKQWNKQSP